MCAKSAARLSGVLLVTRRVVAPQEGGKKKMNVDKITMPVEQAKEAWKSYNTLLKKKKEKYLQDMKAAMFELKKGNELLDIYLVMKNVGLTGEFLPKLALARADWVRCVFRKEDTGRGTFQHTESTWDHPKKKDGFVSLPAETFTKHWPRAKRADGTDNAWEIADPFAKTKIPLIPPHLMPDDDLKNYYILWEVDEWQTIPKADDPLLLKRITENLFVIIGAWDVTKLEQSIIRGMGG